MNVNFFCVDKTLIKHLQCFYLGILELNGTAMEHGPFLGLLPHTGFYPSYLPTLMSNIAQHVMRFTSNGYIQEIQLSCA